MVAEHGCGAEFGGEEMSIPQWKDAPEDANWLAMDSNGIWCWYVFEPYIGYEHWMPSAEDSAVGDNFYIAECDFKGHIDWRETLEPRP